MYCGRCGTEIDYDKTKINQYGGTVEILYYAQCPNCKEELGEKEIFYHSHWDYLTTDELEEIKNND